MMSTTTATTTTLSTHSPVLRIRREQKLAQERLAALSGLSRSWVGYLERNPEAMTPTAAERLARVLNVAPADLLPTAE